jgi:hypothetical protein
MLDYMLEETYPMSCEQRGIRRLMHGHLTCMVAWNERLMPNRAEVLPPPAPSTMIDLVVDTFPTRDGLRAFYGACASSIQSEDVLHAVQRRMRSAQHHHPSSSP